MDIWGIRSTSLTRSYALRRRCNASLNRFHDPTLEGQQGALHHRKYPERAPREATQVYEVMRRANVVNEEACQSLLLKMRDEGLVKFDIHKGRWLIG